MQTVGTSEPNVCLCNCSSGLCISQMARSLSLTHTHTTHTRARAHTHTRTNTHTQTLSCVCGTQWEISGKSNTFLEPGWWVHGRIAYGRIPQRRAVALQLYALNFMNTRQSIFRTAGTANTHLPAHLLYSHCKSPSYFITRKFHQNFCASCFLVHPVQQSTNASALKTASCEVRSDDIIKIIIVIMTSNVAHSHKDTNSSSWCWSCRVYGTRAPEH